MYQYAQGKYTTQGHKGIPTGCYEEEQGRKGFFGQVSHLIKNEASTKWTNIAGPLRPHLYDLVEMKQESGKWQRMFYNADLAIRRFPDQSGWLRNYDVTGHTAGFVIYRRKRGDQGEGEGPVDRSILR